MTPNLLFEKKKSDIKLPLKPKRFLISLLFEKIKLGSSGEYEISDNKNKIPQAITKIPNI